LLSCLWNETFLQSVNFMLPKVVGILLKVNFQAFVHFEFDIFVTNILYFIGTKWVLYVENGL